MALFHSGIENPFDFRLPTLLDEIFLERNLAVWSLNSRRDGIVRHRKNPAFDTQTVPQSVRNLGQFETCMQKTRSSNVCGDISVAELEPRLSAESFQLR